MNIEGVLQHLEKLVAFDTQNPPRALTSASPVFNWLAETLAADFTIDVTDHGLGRVSMLAVRGTPALLFNIHIDTVPVTAGSRFPPFELHREHDRVYGRGACDIKGAAACLLEVAATTTQPLAILFTSDEEGASGCCVNAFIASGKAAVYQQVVVAEPTACRAVLSHRGYLSVSGEFSGVPGHSSQSRALEDNALHKMSAWVTAAVDYAVRLRVQGHSPCFNVGEAHGGVKPNMIAADASVRWSARLSPGQSNERFLDSMRELKNGDGVEWRVPFSGPPLPTAGGDTSAARVFADLHGIETGPVVDFWTEASLFAAAGLPAIVLGPGDIAQAHALDEWVGIGQLERALGIYTKLVTKNA